MNQASEQTYYARRACVALALAEQASSPAVAAIHTWMATRYVALSGGRTVAPAEIGTAAVLGR